MIELYKILILLSFFLRKNADNAFELTMPDPDKTGLYHKVPIKLSEFKCIIHIFLNIGPLFNSLPTRVVC